MAHTFAGSHALGALQQVAGALRESATNLTFDPAGTYATGGIPVTPANVGLSTILFMIPAVFDNGYYGVYVNSTAKIKVFSAAGTELANASAALQGAKALLQASGT
jgi:hypothetical protein